MADSAKPSNGESTDKPYPSYRELQDENAQLRDRLDQAITLLTGIGSQVDLWRQWTDDDVIEPGGPPRGRWAKDGDDR